MSASLDSVIMVGYKIPGSELYQKLRDRGCGHSEQRANFCPECGKPMWLESSTRLVDDEDKLGIFQVRITGWTRDTTETIFIGTSVKSQHDYHSTRASLTSKHLEEIVGGLGALRAALDAELLSRSIDFSKGQFGLHFVAELSL